jgi:N-acetylmuramoyl-L-alanine amidase
MAAAPAWARAPRPHPAPPSKAHHATRHPAHHATTQRSTHHAATRHHTAATPHRSAAREPPPHKTAQSKRTIARQLPRQLPLVVIDPGHGGKDSGAIGARGTLEKDVTLAAARELRHLLLATRKYRVAMTRTDDRFISLAARVAFARSHHAAIVIAIHANASPDKGAHGASVWVRTGTDSVTPLAADPGRIADALTARPHPTPGSAWLQYTLIDNLSDEIRMDAAPARQARFYVLRLPDTPSVLLEMGFLTNHRDEALLTQPRYRRKITESIRDAVNDYFTQLRHPNAKKT